ncbi:DNA polymerase III subunit alpha [Paenibacillus sp. TRM 82003]|uniref:DNA polymerase III subunit alpha n=1 Tax=Kineococcus sp. TRM81007 TaxID=2925831 RepID=UPI001F57E3FD|nr:DNA polymerase III subunit alpha [Kineococcus sp. TRM81007]MCI2239689.1 DNA polymerase III subunit alpha [Kineococcus sp. TRM81007]MCI3926748.1 DNA polymerase III subunit alpha [Paenibacillus sp. TRM 82003]
MPTPSSTPFTHLHVASSSSLRHGVSSPAELVARAAALGMSSLALTDRDGLYGAVRFVRACTAAGLAPVLGTDLATAPTGLLAGLPAWADPCAAPRPRRGPARGGAAVDTRLPRAVVLALGAGAGVRPGDGWGALCELVSATHLAGRRGRPVSSLELIARHGTAPGGAAALAVLLGPGSEVGRALLARRDDLARAVLRRWRAALPEGCLHVEVVCHHAPPGAPGSVQHAARLLALARAEGVPAVLTAAVRHATPDGAVTADLLDAVRRLVPLSARHLDRATAQGHLVEGAGMVRTAREVAHAAAGGRDGARAARELLTATAALAGRARLDPAADLGTGTVHLPDRAALRLPAGTDLDAVLRARCEAGVARTRPGAGEARLRAVHRRLEEELRTVARLGFAAYFLTVADVCDLVRDLGVRVAARGSGAGSLVNHLLGISGVDPLEHGLLVERFLNPRRASLPDIDLDVESHRREDVYAAVLERFGGERVTCLSMVGTHRARHAVRAVGAALGLPPAEVDAIATALPHVRARDVRAAVAELPELRGSGLDAERLSVFLDLVERLDGLPRQVSLHPCAVVLSGPGLLRRTPVETSARGFPMSQFDKDDAEDLGLLKLDVLGVRLQSAMAHAVREVQRVDGVRVDLDDRAQVPLDDPAAFRLVRSTRTLGCFQIESPGQRELVGRFAPETFADLVVDISLFRPGPVQSDVVTPFLRARQGWASAEHLDERLRPHLEETHGVVVFHEQVMQVLRVTTGCDLALADEHRRALGTREGQRELEPVFRRRALERGFPPAVVERVWEVLRAFGSFGFCKAHAAAFALPTLQSAWLKAHHPAAFLAGVLTHDPGMYPKRLLLADARTLGVEVLGLDVNASGDTYRVERVPPGARWARRDPEGLEPGVADGTGYGVRLSLSDVAGASAEEVARVVAGQPYRSLADLWHRARPSRPFAERLVLAGALDALHGTGATTGPARRGRATRRDLLLQVAELERAARGPARARPRVAPAAPGATGGAPAPGSAGAVQLALDLGEVPEHVPAAGLPEVSGAERVRAELEVLGLDAAEHVLSAYVPLLRVLGATPARELRSRRSGSEVLVAGVKVATQTPPVRSGRRVVFLTVDDPTGPADAALFEDAQESWAATVFSSWLLLVRGVLRRTGPRGVSLRATGAWELTAVHTAWREGGDAALRALLAARTPAAPGGAPPRALVHPSGFRQSPYADLRPPGEDVRATRSAARANGPRRLWHASPGSPGW